MNLKVVLLIVFLFEFAAVPGIAQPKKFGEGTLPSDRVFGIAVSPDGKAIYFVNSRGGRDTMTIESARFQEKTLSAPSPVPFSKNPGVWKDIDPFVSPDGRLMLFNSNRPVPGRPNKKDFDIWAANFDGNGRLGEPYHLGQEINSDSADFFATMSAKGNIYFSSMRDAVKGNVDLYVSEWSNGHYLKPVRLPSPANSAYPDSNPFVSPDEKFLIFLRDAPGGYGDSDLYISFKSDNGWSEPVNLGPEINTQHAEFCPFFDTRTQTLYFGRIIRGKPLKENIYSITMDPETFKSK